MVKNPDGSIPSLVFSSAGGHFLGSLLLFCLISWCSVRRLGEDLFSFILSQSHGDAGIINREKTKSIPSLV
jgi:hypothetical protein